MSTTVSKVISFQQTIQNRPGWPETGTSPLKDSPPIGGIIPGTNFAWLAEGPQLQVININTGYKCGSWVFGYVLREQNTEIVHVEAIPKQKYRPYLAVALNYETSGGMICIFDFLSSKIKRSIQIGGKISSLLVLANEDAVHKVPGILRKFDGIFVVGTEGGNVLMINICQELLDGDWRHTRGELNPFQLTRLKLSDLSTLNTPTKGDVKKCEHWAINLNEHSEQAITHFILKGPSQEDIIHVNKEEVAVSALFYAPQISSLLVGYNFGAFQIYNLTNCKLVYTSGVLHEHIPVSHFTFQEPTDDPRSNCYIWTVYSYKNQAAEVLPFASLYVLCFQNKQVHEYYGLLYEGFYAARIQYEMKLSSLTTERKGIEVLGGNCLGLSSAKLRISPNESNDESLPLCFMAWNILYSNGKTETYTAIFDLNQWYRAQMPHTADTHFSNYVIITALNELVHLPYKRAAGVLNVVLKEESIRQFVGVQKLEEHFYPNSLAYNLCCLRLDDTIFLRCVGAQGTLLSNIESSGVLSLVDPSRVCGDIIALGLMPVFVDLPDNVPISTNQQREVILGTALENRLFGWICKCTAEWANGSFLANGCTIDLILNWAFQRVISLKKKCDEMCVPLFDYSGRKLDNNTLALLKSCIRQIKDIHALYIFTLEKLYMFIPDIDFLQARCKSLQTIDNYFEILEWFLNTRLLPECSGKSSGDTDIDNITVPYPNEILIGFYNNRRAVLKASKNTLSLRSLENSLFIDKLISIACEGRELQEEWISCGGNGLYPPPSFQALLRTYLVESLPVPCKNFIVMYVLFDLTMVLADTRFGQAINQVTKFPSIFRIKPSAVKIIQAFWRLDHGEFNSAVGLLLDPLISTDELTDWQHTLVLHTLLAQKQHHLALLYFQIRKPKLKSDDDVLNAVSLFVANNILDEAFNIAKRYHDQHDENKYILHFFSECLKIKQYKSLILRSLNQKDENLLLQYLSECKNPQTDDLKFYYHVLRGQLIEAFDCHEQICPVEIENQGLMAQENATARDKVVENIKRNMPQIIRKILEHCRKQKIDVQEELKVESTPLSLFYLNKEENKKYKSDIIGAALVKTKKTYQLPPEEMKQLHTETTPFLRKPTAFMDVAKQKLYVPAQRITYEEKLHRDPLSPPPAKRLKLTQTNLETPVVKRKKDTSKTDESPQPFVASTPQSILKVKKNDSRAEKTVDEGSFVVPSPPKKKSPNVAARRSLRSSIVRFEGVQNSSAGSSLDDSNKQSTATSTTGEDSFYSLKEGEETPKVSPQNTMHESVQSINPEEVDLEMATDVTESASSSSTEEEEEETEYSRIVYTPTVRKTYKRCYPQDPSETLETPEKSSTSTESSSNTSTPSQEISSRLVPRITARKSLCRSVLESNTLKLWETASTSTELIEKSQETVTKFERDESGVDIETSHVNSKEKTLRYSEFSGKDDYSDSDSSWVYKEDTFDQDKSEANISIVIEATFEDVEMEESVQNEPVKSPEDFIEITSTETSPVAESSQRYTAKEVAKIIETAENVLNTSKEKRENESREEVSTRETSPTLMEEEEEEEKLEEKEPELNVFEIPDDLNVVDTVPVIKEVDLEETELGYDETSELDVTKNVLEEAILEISSDRSEATENEEFSESSSSSEEILNIIITPGEEIGVDIEFNIESTLKHEKGSKLLENESVFEISDDFTAREKIPLDITKCPTFDPMVSINVLEKNVVEDASTRSNSSVKEADSMLEKNIVELPTTSIVKEPSENAKEQQELPASEESSDEDKIDPDNVVPTLEYTDDSEISNSDSENETFLPLKVKETIEQKVYKEIDLIEETESFSSESCSSTDLSVEEQPEERLPTIAEEKDSDSFAVEEEINEEDNESETNVEERKDEEISNSAEEEKPSEKAEKDEIAEIIESKSESVKDISVTDNDTVMDQPQKEDEEKETRIVQKISDENLNVSPESPSKSQSEQSPEKETKEQSTRQKNTKEKPEAKSTKRTTRKTKSETKEVVKSKNKRISPDILDRDDVKIEEDTKKKSSRKKSTERQITQEISDKSIEEKGKEKPKRKKTITKSVSDVSELPRSLRPRTRSVEERAILSQPIKRKRSNSEDQEIAPANRKTRAASVPKVATVILEPCLPKKKPQSVSEGVSNTRRLTRTQAALLKKAGHVQDLDSLDPIVLLDKSSFEGTPDLEEKKVYEKSPSSSSSTTNTSRSKDDAISPPRTRRRANSVTSTTSRTSTRSATAKNTRKKTEKKSKN